MQLAAVITTIQPPTAAMRELARLISGPLIVMGDAKGPETYLPGADLWRLERQRELLLQCPSALPVNSYSRKNVGYLVAIKGGADCIYETDDDTAPNEWWTLRDIRTEAKLAAGTGWVNVYKHFTIVSNRIWPRGLPLGAIEIEPVLAGRGEPAPVWSPIQQSLVDGNPDVDAIYRLVMGTPDVKWMRNAPLALSRGLWSPFNSQSTWWWPQAYPLMYLPSGCGFRMADIWRSFIAQRCLWELDGRVTFHPPEVRQERNAHSIERDFMDELAGYQGNANIRYYLESLKLGGDTAANLLACYEMLVERGFLPQSELRLVRLWLDDLGGL